VSLLPAGGSCAIGMVRAQHTGIWTGISLLTDDITDLHDQWRREGVAFDGAPGVQFYPVMTLMSADGNKAMRP
jgi:hypothetical protein